MAHEIVEAVRQAEWNASQTEAQAVQKAKTILEEARKKASEIKKKRIAQARSEEAAAMADAKSQCEAMLQKADIRVESEKELFRQTISAKKAAAIQAVLDYLL